MIRRITGWFNQHPRATLRVLLAGPLGWISVVYLGSLFILLMHAFWSKDSFTGKVEPFNWTLDAFAQIVGNPVYVTIAARTIGIALLVTITAALIALPVAYYMARIASPRKRALLLIAVTMPLWLRIWSRSTPGEPSCKPTACSAGRSRRSAWRRPD